MLGIERPRHNGSIPEPIPEPHGILRDAVEPPEPMADDPFTLAERLALVDAARAVADSGLIVGAAGNLSVRSDDHLLITPRSARLGRVDPADCVAVALDDGAVSRAHQTDAEPSSETALHRAAYAATGAGAVIHTHSHFATVLSTLVQELPAIHYVTVGFGGPVRVVPYATFGSQELADGVAAALDGRSAALMANHGAVVTAPTIALAVEQALQLEWLASVYWHARVMGSPTLLDAGQLADVAEQERLLRPARAG
ncbi:MAG: L-fuculose-phosphate aldolase [Baekduia sp.]|nr:L-fuculose-phosphate aldolase [Baekduia sp.]